MPALTTLTINDRESTPVAHVFNPAAPQGDVAVFNGTGATLFGRENLTISARQSAGKLRVRMVITDPVVVTETINGVDRSTVSRVAIGEVKLTFDESSTLQERKNLVGLIANAMADSQTDLSLVFTQGESFY